MQVKPREGLAQVSGTRVGLARGRVEAGSHRVVRVHPTLMGRLVTARQFTGHRPGRQGVSLNLLYPMGLWGNGCEWASSPTAAHVQVVDDGSYDAVEQRAVRQFAGGEAAYSLGMRRITSNVRS